MEAETEVMLPQAKELSKLLGPGRGQDLTQLNKLILKKNRSNKFAFTSSSPR